MKKKSKFDKQFLQLEKMITRTKELQKELEVSKRELDETKTEYKSMITAMLKLPPRGVYL